MVMLYLVLRWYVGFFFPKRGIFLSVGILDAPTLFWVRNLKGRNIRPYPIKLWRSCMHREKSGHVIFNYDVIWSKQKYISMDKDTNHTPVF